MSTSNMTIAGAIDIIALHALANRAESIEDAWENYPEISEGDWKAVVARADELLTYPSDEEYTDAYVLLTTRAETA